MRACVRDRVRVRVRVGYCALHLLEKFFASALSLTLTLTLALTLT